MNEYYYMDVANLKDMFKHVPHKDNLKVVAAAYKCLNSGHTQDLTFKGWSEEDEKALHKMCSYLQIPICSVGRVEEELTISVGKSYADLFLFELGR